MSLPPVRGLGGPARREFTVSIISTFRDIHPEREHLRRTVFPRIEELCKARGIRFEEVEIGAEPEPGQRADAAYINACNDLILHRFPFVIGLIGRRYGRLPQWRELGAEAILDDHPWMRDRARDPWEHAMVDVLGNIAANPLMRERSLFCIRSRAMELDPELTQDNEAIVRLDLLRDRLAARGFRIRKAYNSLDTLGEWVLDYLQEVLRQFYPDIDGDDRGSRFRIYDVPRELADQVYVPLPGYTTALDRYLDAGGAPVHVTGPSGAGKSSLLAHWTRRLRAARPEELIITHAFGSITGGNDHVALFRRVMEEIRGRYGLSDEIPSEPARIVEEFPTWLARGRGQRLVLVLDALDRIDAPSRDLRWLPEFLPSSVRLVASTSDFDQSETLLARGWEELPIAPLDEGTRSAIIDALLSGIGGSADPSFASHLAQDFSNANPLLLRLKVLEFDVVLSDQGKDEAKEVLDAGDLPEFYDLILGRLEETFGRDLAARALTVLRVSLRGVTVEEWARAAMMPVEVATRIGSRVWWHLEVDGGRISLSHASMADAIQRRYRDREDIEMEIRRSIAALFARDSTLRGIEERLAQLQVLGDREEIRALLLAPPMVTELIGADRGTRVLAAWVDLHEHEMMESRYRAAVLEGESLSGAWTPRQATVLAGFLVDCGRMGLAGDLARLLLQHAPSPLSDQDRLRNTLTLGSVARHSGRQNVALLNDAASSLEEAIRFGRERFGEQAPITLSALQIFGEIEYVRRGAVAAKDVFEKVTHAIRAARGRLDPMYATAITNYGAALLKEQNRDSCIAAVAFFREALDIRRQLFGELDITTASAMNNLATALEGMGGQDMLEALGLMERALEITTSLYGPRHLQTGRLTGNLAVLLNRAGMHERSEERFEAAISVYREQLGPDHSEIARALANQAGLLKALKRYDESERLLCEALRMLVRTVGRGNPETINMVLNLAGNFRLRADVADDGSRGRADLLNARRLYEKAMPYRIGMYGWQNDGTRRAFDNYVAVLSALDVEDPMGEGYRRMGLK